MYAFCWARSLAILSLFAAGAAIAENTSLTAQVRTANDRFTDVAVAVSEEGAPIPCASGARGKANSRGAFADGNLSDRCGHTHAMK